MAKPPERYGLSRSDNTDNIDDLFNNMSDRLQQNIDLKQRKPILELHQFIHLKHQQFNKHLITHGSQIKPNKDLENVITNITKIITFVISPKKIKSFRGMNSSEQRNTPIIVTRNLTPTEIKQEVQKHF